MQLFGPILLLASLLLAGCPDTGNTTPTLEEVRQTLAATFTSADRDHDTRLSMAEALGSMAGMSASQFSALDTDQDGALSPEELAVGAGQNAAPIRYTYSVVTTFPHDTRAFTQGLIYENETLFEGTGLHGRSSIRRVKLETGHVQQQAELAAEYFGEGITVWGNTLIQLTWQSRKGFFYDKNSFEVLGEFAYDSEGWGITHDGTLLIMSDGTSTLRFLDPNTCTFTREVTVRDGDTPINNLNELEYINGEVWANVWVTNTIVRIDPADGKVVGWVDLSGLLSPEQSQGTDVLNGIAYDAVNDRILVTGKLWPLLFHIEVTPVTPSP